MPIGYIDKLSGNNSDTSKLYIEQLIINLFDNLNSDILEIFGIMLKSNNNTCIKYGTKFFKKLKSGNLNNGHSLPPEITNNYRVFNNKKNDLLEIRTLLSEIGKSNGIKLIMEIGLCNTPVFAERLYSFFVLDIKSIKERTVNDAHAIIVGTGNRNIGMRAGYGRSRSV